MSSKFMFFANFKETADKLPDDLRLKFYDAMTDYVFNGIEPEDVIISALITAIKPSLDKEDGRKNNGGNHNQTGKNQFLKQKEIEQNQKQLEYLRSIPVNSGQTGQFRSIPLETETETETEEKKDNINVIQKKPTFIKPSLEEIEEYCRERNNQVDAQKFYDFYTSNGWKVGKNPMKDWRAAVRTWERSDIAPVGSKAKQTDEEFYRRLEAL